MNTSLSGLSPVSDLGQRFHIGIQEWRLLWQYCVRIASDIIPVGYGNEACGLEEDETLALADRLSEALVSGKTRQYEEAYRARLAALPPETCALCGGTGRRAESPETGPGPLLCACCGGTGKVANAETNIPFSVENVREFEIFLWDCGGFVIR